MDTIVDRDRVGDHNPATGKESNDSSSLIKARAIVSLKRLRLYDHKIDSTKQPGAMELVGKNTKTKSQVAGKSQLVSEKAKTSFRKRNPPKNSTKRSSQQFDQGAGTVRKKAKGGPTAGKCPACSFMGKSQKSFDQHILLHMKALRGKTLLTFECPFCDYDTNNYDLILMHLLMPTDEGHTLPQ